MTARSILVAALVVSAFLYPTLPLAALAQGSSRCPPGLVLMNNTCECGDDYSGVIECDGERSEIERRYWMGYYPTDSQDLVVGINPYVARRQDEDMFPLPNNASLLDEALCRRVYRTGVLCGDCIPGYGPAVNTKYFDCVRCTEEDKAYHWIFFLLAYFVPITILAFIIIFFNISATSGPANAFIFFAQIITTTFGVDEQRIPYSSITSAAAGLEAVYTIPYDIWTLNFISKVLPPYCLSPDINSLDVILIHYTIAFYPLILVAIFYTVIALYGRDVKPVVMLCRPVHHCFARMRRTWSLQRSVIDAFSTFLVLSYTKFTLFSLYLMAQSVLINSEGEDVGQVVYFYGTIDYFSNKHFAYFIPALVVSILFGILPPLVLLLSPWKITHKVLSCLKCDWVWSGGKLQAILDTFQGCYKDGTNGTRDYRYFAGVYFLLRLVLFALFAFTTSLFEQYVSQQIVCTIGILLFAVLRPYKNNLYNVLDATIFGVLATINALSIYQSYLLAVNGDLSIPAYVIQYILIFVPLFYVIGAILWYVWSQCGENILTFRIRKERRLSVTNSFTTFAQTVDACRRVHRLRPGRVSEEPEAELENYTSTFPLLSPTEGADERVRAVATLVDCTTNETDGLCQLPAPPQFESTAYFQIN